MAFGVLEQLDYPMFYLTESIIPVLFLCDINTARLQLVCAHHLDWMKTTVSLRIVSHLGFIHLLFSGRDASEEQSLFCVWLPVSSRTVLSCMG